MLRALSHAFIEISGGRASSNQCTQSYKVDQIVHIGAFLFFFFQKNKFQIILYTFL